MRGRASATTWRYGSDARPCRGVRAVASARGEAEPRPPVTARWRTGDRTRGPPVGAGHGSRSENGPGPRKKKLGRRRTSAQRSDHSAMIVMTMLATSRFRVSPRFWRP